MTDEIIGSPKVVASADTRQAAGGLTDLARTGDSSAKILNASFEQISRTSKQTEASIRSLGSSITGSGASQKFSDLAAAVDRAGGVSEFAGKRLELLTAQIKKLEAAGGTAPAALHGIAVEASKLQEVTSQIGTAKLQELAGSLGPVGEALVAIGPAGLAAAAAVAAIGESVVKFAEFGHEIGLMHAQTGLATTTIQEFRFAAGGAGIEVGGLTGLVGKMDTAIEHGSPAFEKLGLDFRELKNETPDEAIHNVTTALDALGTEQQKIAVGREIFGRNFQSILPAIENLERLKNVAHEAGLVLGEEDVAAGEHLAQGWNELKLMGEGLSNTFAAGLLKGTDFRRNIEELVPAVNLLAKGLRDAGEAGEAGAFALKYLNPIGQAVSAGSATGSFLAAAHDYLTGNHPEAPGLAKGSPKPPGDYPTAGAPPTLSTAERTEVYAGKDLDRQTARHLQELREEDQVKQEAIRLEKEYATAAAGTATGLDGAIEKIHAEAQAERESIDLKAQTIPAFAASKDALLSEVDAIERQKVAQATAAATRKTAIEATKLYADAEKLTNETLVAGMTPLQVAIHGIEAKKFAEIDAAQATFTAAQAEGRETDELLKATNAKIRAANASAKGAEDHAKEANALQVEAASIASVDRAQKAYTATIEQTSPSLQHQIDKINETRDASIRQAGEAFKAGQVTAAALIKDIELYNKAAAAATELAKASNAATKVGQAGQALGALNGLAQELGLDPNSKAARIGSAGERELGAASKLLEGVAEKNPAKIIIGGIEEISARINLVKTIFGGKSADQQALYEVGRDWGVKISKGLSDTIGADVKRVGDRAASLLHLTDIIKEGGGVKEFGADKAAGALSDLFVQVESGKVSLKEAGKVFDENFGAIAAEHISKTTGLASAQLLQLVELSKQFGMQSPAVNEFLKGQATGLLGNLQAGVAGMADLRQTVGSDAGRSAERATKNRLKDSGLSDDEIASRVLRAGNQAADAAAKGVGIVSQRAASALGTSVVATFDQLVSTGLSRSEALKQVTPLVQSMKKELTAAGFEGGQAFAGLEQTIGITTGEITGPLVAGISAFSSALVNMHNMGLLNQETFSGLTEQISANIAALADQGVTGAAAVQVLEPDLQKIWELEQDYGYAVDAGTQSLIDQAVAAGAVGEKHRSAADQLVDASARMAAALEFIAGKYGYVGAEADKALKNRSATNTVTTNYVTGGNPPPGSPGSFPGGNPPPTLQPGDPGYDPYAPEPLPAHAAGGLFPYRPGGTVGIFGEQEDEYAVPKSKAMDFVAAMSRGVDWSGVGRSSWDGGISRAAATPARAAASSPTSVTVAGINIAPGAIVVHGANDPEATAAAVADALGDQVAGKLVTRIREITLGRR